MQDPANRLLPFVTRDMLSFEHGTTFGIRIKSQSSASASVDIRGFTREGTFRFRHSLGAGAGTQTEDFNLSDVPIMLSVFDMTEALNQGEAYCQISLIVNGTAIAQLASGSVYGQKSISWPVAQDEQTTPGMGFLRNISGANPAAGIEATIAVPDARIWKVRAVQIRLITAATVGSRRVHLSFSGSTGFLYEAFSGIDQIISETRDYFGAAYGAIPDEIDGTKILIAIPQDLILDENSTIDTVTTNLAAGDNYGAMSVLVEQFVRL